MAGYIGSKTSVAQVDGYTRTEADAGFVSDPNGAITVDSSNNVGIGTSSPAGLLDVQNTSGSATVNVLGSTNTIIRARQTGNTGLGYFSFGRSEDIFVGGLAYDHDDDHMRLYANNSERMRIDDAGRVLFKCRSSPSASNTGSGFVPEADGRMVLFQSGSSTGQVSVQRFYNPNGQVGEIKTQSSSTLYVTSSDYRLKTDAQPLTGSSARVQALNPVNFEWIADGTRVDGFLAHEAQEVVPEAVTGTKDAMRDEEYEVTPAVLDDDGNVVTEAVMGTQSVPDYQGIDQSKLVPLLTAALQEALTEIADLKARVTALEAV